MINNFVKIFKIKQDRMNELLLILKIKENSQFHILATILRDSLKKRSIERISNWECILYGKWRLNSLNLPNAFSRAREIVQCRVCGYGAEWKMGRCVAGLLCWGTETNLDFEDDQKIKTINLDIIRGVKQFISYHNFSFILTKHFFFLLPSYD